MTTDLTHMEIVIRNQSTKKFYLDGDEWTLDIKQAFHFPHTLDAMSTGINQNLVGCEILMRFYNDPVYDASVSIPI